MRGLTKCAQQRLPGLGRVGLKSTVCAIEVQCEKRCMQGHAAQAGIAPLHLFCVLGVAIARVADERMALARGVLPDLVRSTCSEREVDER